LPEPLKKVYGGVLEGLQYPPPFLPAPSPRSSLHAANQPPASVPTLSGAHILQIQALAPGPSPTKGQIHWRRWLGSQFPSASFGDPRPGKGSVQPSPHKEPLWSFLSFFFLKTVWLCNPVWPQTVISYPCLPRAGITGMPTTSDFLFLPLKQNLSSGDLATVCPCPYFSWTPSPSPPNLLTVPISQLGG
jgi:hypothetical protein